MAFRNGVYKILYDDGSPGSAGEHALVVMRDGSFLGSDPNGGVFSGTVEDINNTAPGSVSATLTVPPLGELVTGFRAGGAWAKVAVSGHLEANKLLQEAVVEIDGVPLAITLCYMGPLPD